MFASRIKEGSSLCVNLPELPIWKELEVVNHVARHEVGKLDTSSPHLAPSTNCGPDLKVNKTSLKDNSVVKAYSVS